MLNVLPPLFILLSQSCCAGQQKLTGVFSLVCLLSVCCFEAYASGTAPKSGSQISSFGTVSAAIGVTDKKLSGFYHFTQVKMPGRSFHADCKIFFFGDFFSDKAMPVRATTFNSKAIEPVNGVLTFNGYIKFAKSLPAVQSFTLVLAENIPNCTDEIDVLNSEFGFEINKLDDWKSISVVSSKRAYFHSDTQPESKKKSFLVAGDSIYIYDEKPGWYFVKFRAGKKETTGWIKKADTIQISE